MKVTDEGVPVGTLISIVKDSIKRAGVSTANSPTSSPRGCASAWLRGPREG
jgi:hypothetical protein